MKKKHSSYKKVLHPNRYFIWALIITIFGGIFFSIYITTKGYEIQNEAAFPELKTNKVYANTKEGYSLKYPQEWAIDPSGDTDSVVFINPTDKTESVTVVATDLASESIIRRSMRITEEARAYSKDNMTVTLLQGTRNNENIEAAIIKSGKRLYYISGNSDAFMTFVGNFKALNR